MNEELSELVNVPGLDEPVLMKRGPGRPKKNEQNVPDGIIKTLKVFTTHPDIEIPKFQTEGSACFDLAYNPAGKNNYFGYNANNSKFERFLNNENKFNLYIGPHERVMVPTGLIFDIPQGYSVRVHPRSGLSLKNGLVCANAEGIVDSDYVEECFVLLHNLSENGHMIMKGDRLAQAELVKNETYIIVKTEDKPEQKTNRNGGFGSTGVN